MLRRRILASAMASVMAIGSVAVVASAEETAAATTQVKTKADLEAYVKSFDGFRSKEINDYGSVSGEKFLDAIEYADNVIEDAKATVDDYTVAYQMIESTYKALKIYTAEELASLIKTNKAKYETNNIYNEELGDAIYDADKWKNFTDAYEDADAVQGSKDSRIISDAYETLKSAAEALGSGLTTVTKSQYRAVLKSYENLKQNVYKYDTWRRGAITSDWKDDISDFWKFQGKNASFGAMFSWAVEQEETIYDSYDKLDSFKTVSKTSREDITSGYTKANQVVGILSNWSADDTNRASKASVKSLIDQYRGAMVFDFANGRAKDLLGAIDSVAEYELNGEQDPATHPELYTQNGVQYELTYGSATHVNPSDEWHGDASFKKISDAAINLKALTRFYIPVDAEGLWVVGEDVLTTAPTKDKYPTGVDSYRLVSKGTTVDLTDFIKVEDVVAANYTSTLLAEEKKDTTTIGDKVTASDAVIDAKKGEIDADIASVDTKIAAAAKADKASWKAFKSAFTSTVSASITSIEKDYDTIGKSGATSTEIRKAVKSLKKTIKTLSAYGANGSEFRGYAGNVNWNGDIIPWNAGSGVDAIVANVTAFIENAEAEAERLEAIEYANRFDGYISHDTNNMGKNDVIDAAGEYFGKGTGVTVNKVFEITEGKTLTNINVDLAVAMKLANTYIAGKDKIESNGNIIYDINTTDELAAGTAKGSAAEWTIVYRYLKYALSDKYDMSQSKYTKAQVVELLEKSYDLAEKTGDAGLFAYTHQNLVDERKAASEWVAAANKDKKYRDNVSTPLDMTATTVYEKLNSAYGALENDFNAFAYSFGDVYNKIAEVKQMIDDNDLTATDSLLAAVEEAAYRLSVVESLDNALDTSKGDGVKSIDDDAFTTDRFFNDFNRVFTKGDDYTIRMSDSTQAYVKKDNAAYNSHNALKAAYDALDAEVKKQTEKTVLLGDVNGDGVVNALDASAILKAVVNNTVIETAVGDYNADGAVNALDASAILKFVVSQA